MEALLLESVWFPKTDPPSLSPLPKLNAGVEDDGFELDRLAGNPG